MLTHLGFGEASLVDLVQDLYMGVASGQRRNRGWWICNENSSEAESKRKINIKNILDRQPMDADQKGKNGFWKSR